MTAKDRSEDRFLTGELSGVAVKKKGDIMSPVVICFLASSLLGCSIGDLIAMYYASPNQICPFLETKLSPRVFPLGHVS